MLEFDSLIVIVVDDLDDYEDVICVDSKKRKISQAVRNILGIFLALVFIMCLCSDY